MSIKMNTRLELIIQEDENNDISENIRCFIADETDADRFMIEVGSLVFTRHDEELITIEKKDIKSFITNLQKLVPEPKTKAAT